MDFENFFKVHADLPREGPGCDADVAWALTLAELPAQPSLVDLGCGPGADIAALRASGGVVLGIDSHGGFVAQARARYSADAGVRIEQGDMAVISDHDEGPFDFIWCAGALYFLGLDNGLQEMFAALRPGGVLAFSEPCFFDPEPSAAARAFFEGYPAKDPAGIESAVRAAGFSLLGARAVTDQAWEAYYQPMEAKIEALYPGADSKLTEMLELCSKEAADWRRLRREVGYHLCVARRPA